MQVRLGCTTIVRSLCSDFVSEGWKIDLGQPNREDLVTLVTKFMHGTERWACVGKHAVFVPIFVASMD